MEPLGFISHEVISGIQMSDVGEIFVFMTLYYLEQAALKQGFYHV